MIETLGKGAQHALLIYQEWFRTGLLLGQHPAFANAKKLFDTICSSVDWTIPALNLVHRPLNSRDLGDDVLKHQEGNTTKFLIKTQDQLDIESVIIPMQAGGTLCLSSQVGCRMGCTFCETGRMGLIRHLTVSEIVSQVFIARFILKASVRNLVFMGMGEPFDNYDAVMEAIKVFIDPHGFGFGPQNITISTSGRVEEIHRLTDHPGAIPNLALSLNAPNDQLRNRLMPINRKHSMQDLYCAIQTFNEKRKKSVLIAYVLLRNFNDHPEHAAELASYLQGLNVKINLIPYNPQSRDRFQSSEPAAIAAFKESLIKAGYRVLVRKTKGQSIMAACGQLGNLALRNASFG